MGRYQPPSSLVDSSLVWLGWLSIARRQGRSCRRLMNNQGGNRWVVVAKIWVNYNELTVLPSPGNHGRDRETAAADGRTIQVIEVV